MASDQAGAASWDFEPDWNATMASSTRTGSLVFAIMILAATVSSAVAGESLASLYQTATIVTGQREETRIPGIQRCFIDVILKASGDQTLATSLDVISRLTAAPTFVTNYSYHDRLWKRPIHDEQGTRDRPYDLTVLFDPSKIDAVLHAVGYEPWTADRPRVVVFLAVEQGGLSYLTSTNGQHGFGQAEAFLDASTRTGVPVVIPDQDALAAWPTTVDQVRVADPELLQRQAVALGGDLPLIGTMRFSDADLGWTADWRFAWKGVVHRWSIKGVNFDAAFLNAMRGVAQIASGHGAPL